MATLDDLDTALANAKTLRAGARAPLLAAKAAWQAALVQLRIVDHRLHQHGAVLPPTPSSSVTTAQLQGLADAVIAAQTTNDAAETAVIAAQVAFNAASKAAKVS
jgi:hypothetical protein